MNASDMLKAAAAIMDQRAAEYDSAGGERSMEQTVAIFNRLTGRDLMPSEGWVFMLLLKLVRQWSAKGYHQDSAADAIAYAALLAEALQEEDPKDV